MDRKYLKSVCLTNDYYDNIDDSYLDVLDSYRDVAELDIQNIKELQDWMRNICEKYYTASIYFLSIDISNVILQKYNNVDHDQLYMIGAVSIAIAIFDDKNLLYEESILKALMVKDTQFTLEDYKDLFRDNYDNMGIATKYDYLHFFNEMMWKKNKIDGVKTLYSEMISYMANVRGDSSKGIAFYTFNKVLEINGMDYAGKIYVKDVKIGDGNRMIPVIRYREDFLLPPYYKLADEVKIKDFIKRKEIDYFVDVDKVVKAIDNPKDNLSTLFNVSGSRMCQEVLNMSEIDYVGRGAQGSVFTIDNVDGVVVKRYPIESKKGIKVIRTNNMIISLDGLHEILVSAKLSILQSGLKDGSYCKNFLNIDGYFICPNPDKCNNYLAYIVMEEVDESFKNIIYNNADFIESIFFQILISIVILQKVYQGVHNDLHKGNIMFKKIDKKYKYLKYIVGGIEYNIPNYGYVFKMIDPGLMALYKPQIITTEVIVNNEFYQYGIVNEFLPGYDIAMVMYEFIINIDQMSDIKIFMDKLIKQVYEMAGFSTSFKTMKTFKEDFYDLKLARPKKVISKLKLGDLVDNKVFDKYRFITNDSYTIGQVN